MELACFQRSANRVWSPALEGALDSPRTLVLVFAGGADEQVRSIPAEVFDAFPSSVIVGCSTSGEICGDAVFDDTVTVGVAKFSSSELVAVAAPLLDARGSQQCGADLAAQLLSAEVDGPLRAVLILAPGLEVNGSALVRGLGEALPADVQVTGGLAGDGSRFGDTWVLADGHLLAEQAVVVGFFGRDLRVGHGSEGGWEVFGPERRITAAEGNVLRELDGKPALELYRAYLGNLADDLPASGLRFPLAVRESDHAERALVRTLLAIDEDEQSMIFAGDVPQDWSAQLMGADADQLLDGAHAAAGAAVAVVDVDQPVLAVAVSCVGRRMVLGEACDEELERTLEVLPPGSLQVGFYSFGELSPSTTGVCELHNQTMTMTTIAEV